MTPPGRGFSWARSVLFTAPTNHQGESAVITGRWQFGRRGGFFLTRTQEPASPHQGVSTIPNGFHRLKICRKKPFERLWVRPGFCGLQVEKYRALFSSVAGPLFVTILRMFSFGHTDTAAEFRGKYGKQGTDPFFILGAALMSRYTKKKNHGQTAEDEAVVVW
ncbi:hypothetical protein FQR65_LT20422 [Abscondita terminalis]|nr:hypothetical protein FQR65_LT20422 [Abscondita terminalis]